MERQRSLSLKSRRLLCFAVSSSFLFCFLFYYCLLNIAPLLPRKTHFQFSPCNKTKEASFGETFFWEATNLSQQTFNLTLPAKDVVFANIHVEENGNLSGEVLDLRNGEKEMRGNVSSLEMIESVKQSNAANLGSPNLEKGSNILERNQYSNTSKIGGENNEKKRDLDVNKNKREVERECNIYNGRWVFDERYPLYGSKSCSFIDEGFSCEANGRTDRDYMKWRWRPNHCDIPRFNPVTMLELIKGKRLVFVGDSINRNQWESMMCILQQAVLDPKRIYEARGRRITKEKGQYNFKFADYNCSIEYYVTHFLVHESKARVGTKRVKTLRIDTVDKGASKWRGADILVFNTAHWWSHHKTKSGVNYYQEGNLLHPHLDVTTAFHKSLKTWAWWVDRYVNPAKTQVFFRSSSPSHFSGGEWNAGGHCKESKQPLNFTSGKQVPVPEMNLIVQQVIDQMATPVTVLNITNLSGLRIDGHPSIYGRKPAIGAQPSGIQDCSHWCLPGVPDTWNELLYYYIVSRQRSR
ncbi:protein trichome birefringence-like 6 [Carex littledalei]|uniref:Protein trichome birefringence-like 6 n=1 Tax=Carex littledalei TaxID=544730 RepID=A0A833VGY8_9POAL|nr:protein trichome birefringence-like 6 [Carex littledalei]